MGGITGLPAFMGLTTYSLGVLAKPLPCSSLRHKSGHFQSVHGRGCLAGLVLGLGSQSAKFEIRVLFN